MLRISKVVFWWFLAGICGTGLILSSFYLFLQPGLPPVGDLRDVKLQIPLRIYSSDNKLIAEFGEKRRTPITIDQVPQLQIDAFLAAEDSRFYQHHGVDPKGLMRAAVELATTGSIQSGGSTITMQVAKNYFLSREQTFIRKFKQILLAIQIENELTKSQILELYLNKIYLGNRAYGIEAAAQVYYGQTDKHLTLPQMAMLAGLPKAPSAYNPLADAQRAMVRRNWILQRMHKLGYITEEQLNSAVMTPLTASYHGPRSQLHAPYVAEMARADVVSKFGDAAYTDGYQVKLTVNSARQEAANQAIHDGLEAYTKRHGYLGPAAHWDIGQTPDQAKLQDRLNGLNTIANLTPAVVLSMTDQAATVLVKDHGLATMPLSSMQWARRYIDQDRRGPEPKKPSDILQDGDVVYVTLAQPTSDGQAANDTSATDGGSVAPPAASLTVDLAQVPKVEGALVALDPHTGAIEALEGGFSFSDSKYNRALLAKRQPGSNFKPFLYLAALENGDSAATIINDAPIVFNDSQLETEWRPENAGGHFNGPTRLRQALYQSRNLVSIRLLRDIGIDKVLSYVKHLGLDTSTLPDNLTLALGSGTLTPMDIARGFAVIANGGYSIQPYLIQSITDGSGKEVYQAPKVVLCDTNCDDLKAQHAGDQTVTIAPRVADARAVYIMHSILHDVITKGTGRRALALNRTDIAGKTGTTNDQRDAWFSGFNYNLSASVWVGFDQPAPLGRGEYGAVAALPVWMEFMKSALKGSPPAVMPEPPGIVTVRIDPETGKRAPPGDKNAMFELFRQNNVPPEESAAAESANQPNNSTNGGGKVLPQQLF
ncbi:penicillin-binding protein 1A [Mangrovitalea sediminis]|uniref:penicillin-binding protein 1A n=1 Tax=Mangrovitalea sediminis TaxID=1982043 RepID=UPI00387361CC